jgi:hypothetical protein
MAPTEKEIGGLKPADYIKRRLTEINRIEATVGAVTYNPITT